MSINIRIVLVHPSHPGNIGAAARAMKTMDLDRLYLVAPQRFPSTIADARASGAQGILKKAVVCANLGEAIQDCQLTVGTTARDRNLPWPVQKPAQCATKLVMEAQFHPVAVLFGQERTGLSNQELEACNALTCIPSNPDFSSLNLAAAVQILAYEIHGAMQATTQFAQQDSPLYATAGEMKLFYEHLQQTLIDIGFLNPDNPRRLMHRLHRFFQRARPEKVELNILRGFLSATQGGKSMPHRPKPLFLDTPEDLPE